MSSFADQRYVSPRFRAIGYAVIYALLTASLVFVLAKLGNRGPQLIPVYDGAILLGLAILGAPVIVLALWNYLRMRAEFEALEREHRAVELAVRRSDDLAAELKSEFEDVTEQDDHQPIEARLTSSLVETPSLARQWFGLGGSGIVTVAGSDHGE